MARVKREKKMRGPGITGPYALAPLEPTINCINRFADHRIIAGSEQEVDPKKVDQDGWYHPGS
jgi:hypothetical protein